MHHSFFRKDLKNRGPVTSLVGPARWRYLEQPDLELQPQEAVAGCWFSVGVLVLIHAVVLVGLILFNVDLMVVIHVGSLCLGLVLVDSGYYGDD